MEYRDFLSSVEQQTHLDSPRAEQAVRATLQTLSERLSKGQARDLLEHLPPELKPVVYKEDDAQAFTLEEFLRRVAAHEGTDDATAYRHARAVFWTLGRAVPEKEIADVAAELPQEFAPLVAEARGVFLDVLPADDFLLRVAERADVDLDTARRAAEATLETLAERIAGGEVEDLLAHLPLELHGPLHRVKDDRRAAAQRMSLDDFVERIAEREGTDRFTAFPHAQAVFVTLQDAVGEEFSDVRSQLPPEYAELLSGPPRS
ncbi:MAG: hypothetical protein QOC93_3669 [Actinomycetota bacterium]|jgi:uncharacterized protein (DUF2267 family)|nr:hypothetical protein [Cryptosporangiaceae bacterium]MDQ1678525.1 hypothetical protein [Actinomycetota bacterium]